MNKFFTKQAAKMALPMVEQAIDKLVQQASDVELLPGEKMPLLQLFAHKGKAMIGCVAIDELGNPVRALWGPYEIKHFVNAEALSEESLGDLLNNIEK